MNFRNELHYITPISNIASILEHGLLSNNAVNGVKHSSVALNVVQERREIKSVPNGLKLHQYVNLYFDARNPMMFRRKEQVNDLCVLVVKADVLKLEGVVIADRNAASDYVAFRSSPDGLNSLDFDKIYAEDWRDTQNKYNYYYNRSTKCAEVLVPNHISPDYIIKAIVGNQIAQNKLVQTGFSLTIIINPRLFFLE